MRTILEKTPWSWIATIILLGFVLYKRVPEAAKNYQLEHQIFPAHTLMATNKTPTNFPPQDGRRSAVLFWATWCGPCKLEMELIKKSVAKNNLPADRVFAIHIEGSAEQVQAHMNKYEFPFPALIDRDGRLAHALDVTMTPSLFFIDERGRIDWASSGLGPTDVFRMERFLGNR